MYCIFRLPYREQGVLCQYDVANGAEILTKKKKKERKCQLQ